MQSTAPSKSGAYHLHGQLFAQCVHQFTPLQDLVDMGNERMLEILRRFSDYTAHVRRMVYCDVNAWREQQEEVEAEWPENRGSPLMLSRPDYQNDQTLEASAWKREYLARDVEGLQKRKQHHVHIPDAHGVRQPLEHCRDPQRADQMQGGLSQG